MILVDTSVWISFLKKDDQDLHYILKKYLKTEEVATTSVIFGELFQGVKNKREANILEIIWASLPKFDESELFIKAGKISNQHRLYAHGVGLIDCSLLALCLENKLALWTLDKKLQNAFDRITNED